jgi:hypothetical protein
MNFAIAEKLQQAAFELDEYLAASGLNTTATRKHIDTLHACTIELAGRRAHELYGSEAEAEVLSATIAAGMTCCANEVNVGPGWSAMQGATA